MESMPKDKLNYAWTTILCVDVLKLPLKDILKSYVKPEDLSSRIQGISLSPEQRKACKKASRHQYSDFDITLLYELIKNLCTSLEKTNEWGIEPKAKDKKIGDDIERIRLFRNRNLGHAIKAQIHQNEFNNMWNNAENILQRMYNFTTTNGCNSADYLQKQKDVINPNLTYEEYVGIVESFTVISLKGETTYVIGENAHLTLEVNCENYEKFSIDWWKKSDEGHTKIARETKKYSGTTDRELFINSVSKEDEGRYQASLCQKLNVYVTSNTVSLKIQEVGLPTFYLHHGANCRFSHLFDHIAENYPIEKIDRLKDLIENSDAVQDVPSIRQAKSVRDCLRILRDEKTFTALQVMVVQYLMKKTDCADLENACIEYAKEDDNIMYFYVKKEENGRANIFLHICESIRKCSPKSVMNVKETLAAMLECPIDDIHVAGYQDSTSFFLVLSIKRIYVDELLALGQQKKKLLIQLNIDFFVVWGKKIYLGSLKDAKEDGDEIHLVPLTAGM